MVVPFGVGVGDFIAVAKLTKDVVAELRKDSEAVSHYQSLVVELESLDSALLRINQIKPARHELVHLDAIRAAAAGCERPLEAFLAKLRKYDGTMGTWNAAEKRFEGIGRRVQYGLEIWGDVGDLRSTLASHIATITILMLAQTMTSLSAAETERAEIASAISNATSVLRQVNDQQKETHTDLKIQTTTLDTLKATVDQSNNLNREASDRAEHALDILHEAVAQSREVNEDMRMKVERQSNCDTEFQSLAIDGQSNGHSRPADGPRGEIDTHNEDEIRDLQKETNGLKAELDRMRASVPVENRTYAIGASSILDTTSKVLNLVLSGIMAASMWTLMNQSQEIATLSRMLIENCNVTTAGQHRSSDSSCIPTSSTTVGLRRQNVFSGPSKSNDAGSSATPEPQEIGRFPGLLRPTKFSGPGTGDTANPSFVVRIDDLGSAHIAQMFRHNEYEMRYPPESPQDVRLRSIAFFRWSNGVMEAMSASDPALSAKRSSTKYSVATVFTHERYDELLAVNFDAARQIVFDADNRKRRWWRQINFRHERLPLEQSPSTFKSKHFYTHVGYAGLHEQAAVPMPGHIVPQLLPKRYNGRKGLEKRENAGLVGSLPLLIALAVFSAPRRHMQDTLLDSIRPGRWVPHEYGRGRDGKRGVVISVYYDPANPAGSNKESLDRLEWGQDGPFYGPDRLERGRAAESGDKQKVSDKSVTAEEISERGLE